MASSRAPKGRVHPSALEHAVDSSCALRQENANSPDSSCVVFLRQGFALPSQLISAMVEPVLGEPILAHAKIVPLTTEGSCGEEATGGLLGSSGK